MKLREFLNTFSLFLDDNEEKLVQTNEDSEPHTILIDSAPLPKEEKEEEEEEIEIITGVNKFETRFLTLLNYLSSYRDEWMQQNVLDFPYGNMNYKNAKRLSEFLYWKNMDISYNNFTFIIDFVVAVQSFIEQFPVTVPYYNYKYDENTKSLMFSVKDIYRNKQYDFDLYTVPDMVITIFDDNPLESYINDNNKNSNKMYLCIAYVDIVNDYNRQITIVNGENMECNKEDKYLLESILIRTYELCIRMYNEVLVDIINRYFTINAEYLDEFLKIGAYSRDE